MSKAVSRKAQSLGIVLCLLISERNIADEISDEIRDLLKRGADINFRDSNRDNFTSLHLAIAKRDAICVEFLLPYKPDMGVMNEAGETPEALARRMNCEEIVNLLTQ